MNRPLLALSLSVLLPLVTGCDAQARPPTAAAAVNAAVAPPAIQVPTEGAALKGPAGAPVTLVEFTDYQCPFCVRANATVARLLAEYGPKLRLAVHQNPLEMHPYARQAALAAMAAGEQGRYWEMHDKLFASRGALDPQTLERFAQELGLSLPAFRESLASPRLQAALDKELALAGSLGINGTPTFFVNGRRLVGAQPLEVFKAAIDEELRAAR